MDINALIRTRCPRCANDKMFKGVFKMNTTCASCGFKYEREEGYFTSAIVIANFLYALFVAPTILILTTMDYPTISIVIILTTISIILVPLIFRYARAIWLYLDFYIHPEK